ncbi:conserved hypothetical protein [Cupriavidus taiwanensis]|uniref:Uncharacterized protein n=1 Tax=Cupriavidus taiwanensis TaxID=164546 RepID=A0A975WXA1_9BURK|nr:conserved hypothetical protein [Cupriavidus taiwanensis]
MVFTPCGFFFWVRDYVVNRGKCNKICCIRCENRYIILSSLQTLRKRRRWKNPAVTVQSIGYGAIAQLGERLHGMQEVSGSIPLSSTRIWEASEKKLPKREKACYDGGLSSARQKTR